MPSSKGPQSSNVDIFNDHPSSYPKLTNSSKAYIISTNMMAITNERHHG
jgi:hypothetical protein